MLAASTLCGPRAHAMATMPGTACAINSSGAEAGCSMQIAAAVRMCCGRHVLLPCSPSRHLSQLPVCHPHLLVMFSPIEAIAK